MRNLRGFLKFFYNLCENCFKLFSSRLNPETRRSVLIAKQLQQKYSIPKTFSLNGTIQHSILIGDYSADQRNSEVVLTVDPDTFVKILQDNQIYVIYLSVLFPRKNNNDLSEIMFWINLKKIRIVTCAGFEANHFFKNILLPALKIQSKIKGEKINLTQLIISQTELEYAFFDRLFEAMVISVVIPSYLTLVHSAK